MGLPKAVVYMSIPPGTNVDDMVVYVRIRKLSKTGEPMININIHWSRCPYPNVAAIPENDYSNLMIYFGPLGIL